MKPKILYLIDNLLVGGAQTQLTRLIAGIGDSEYDLRVLCLGDSHERLISRVGSERVATFPMMCIWKPEFWMSYYKVKQSVRANKPDIVHTYLNTSNVLGAYVARKMGVPYIVTSRRDMGHFRSSRVAAMERWSNRFCHKVVCVSQAVKRATIINEHLDPDKAVVLYSGVDTSLFDCGDGGRPVDGVFRVGMVAAIDRAEKGHLDFLQMAERVHRKNREIKFVLVGDGFLRPNLERFVQEKGLQEAVIFKGRSSDVHKEISQFNIFVMPSHSEGFSNAVLEAMAMRVPVLANALEGNLEIIDDGENGLLVEPRDIARMAQHILHYAGRRDELRVMGEKARTKIQSHFTLKHMVERYKSFYNGLLNGK